MIGALKGIVTYQYGTIVVLDVNGVGYEIWASEAARKQCVVGSDAQFIIHTEVQESLLRLYGFVDFLEKQVFHLLMRVKGVGAKSASEIISKIDKIQLLRIIAAGDVAELQQVKGIGKKTAERIVVELKDKVGEYVLEGQINASSEITSGNGNFSEALSALLALGFPRKEAENALQKAKKDVTGESDSGLIVKAALRYF